MKYVPSAHPAVSNTISSDMNFNNVSGLNNLSNFFIGYEQMKRISGLLERGVFLFDFESMYFHFDLTVINTYKLEIIIDNESFYNMALDITLA
jgi:hypothetical protein